METEKAPSTRLAQVLAAALTLFGLSVIIGWHTQTIPLVQIVPGKSPMVYNTAVCVLFSGLGVFSILREKFLPSFLLASALFALTTLTLAEYIFGTSNGIDHFLYKQPVSLEPDPKGRMAVNTSLAFFFASLCYFVASSNLPKKIRAPFFGLTGCMIVVIGIIPLLGYLEKMDLASSWGSRVQISPQTAACIVCLGVAFASIGWQWRERSEQTPLWITQILGVSGLFGTMLLWQAVEHAESQQIRQMTRAVLDSRVGAAKSRIEESIAAMRRSSERWARRGKMSSEEWKAEARDYLADFPELRAMEWANLQKPERWTMTLGGDQTALEREIPLETRQKLTEEHVKTGASSVLSRVVRFSNGESGMFTFVPTSSEETPSGLIIGILRFRPFFEALSSSETSRGFFQRITLDGEEIFANRGAETSNEKTLSEETEKEIYDRKFHFRCWPGNDYFGKPAFMIAPLVLILGAVISMLVAAIAHFAQTNHIRYRKTLEAQASLQETEAAKSAILESATQGIITIDLEGNVLTVNPAVTKLFGYKPAEILGRNVKMLIPSPMREEHDGYLRNYRDTRIKKIIGTPREVIGQRKNGETFPLLLGVSESKTDRGTLYTGILHDLSELKEAQLSLERKAKELASSNTDLEQFAYVASHDLQEPLRMITNFLQLLEEEYKDKLSPEASKWIFYAVDGGKRMKILIQDLLAFSRVGRRARIETVEVAEVLEDVRSNLAQTIEESGVELQIGDMPTLVSDRTQVLMLFQNVIGNAIKFRSDKPPRISIRSRMQEGLHLFEVADNGIGIPQEHRKKVFDLFTRLHGANKYPGTGLGLAICKKIVEWHGGRIWLETGNEGGTRVCFLLPPVTARRPLEGALT